MDDGRSKSEESLDSLKRNIDDAKLRFDLASQHLKQVQANHLSGEIPSPDPDARERAIHTIFSSRAEYQRVAKIYEAFVARAARNGSAPQVRGTKTGAGTYGDSTNNDKEGNGKEQ